MTTMKSLECFLGRPTRGYSKPPCYHCGQPCSGDVTEIVMIVDGLTAEKPICDNPDACPANQR